MPNVPDCRLHPTESWSSRMRSFAKAALIGPVLFMFVLWYSGLTTNEFYIYTRSTNALVLVPAFGLYLTMAFIRAVRLESLLASDLRMSRVAGYSFQHHCFVTLFPFRLGELSLPLLLKREGITVSRTLAVLAVIRLTDLFALLLCLIVGLWWSLASWPESVQRAFPVMCGMAFFAASGILAILFGRSLWSKIPIGILSNLPFQSSGFDWGIERFRDFQASLNSISLRRLLVSIVIAVLIWGILGLQSALLFGGFAGIEIPAMTLSTAAYLMAVMNFLPVQSLAGIGTFEAMSFVSLSLAGVSDSEAAAHSVLVHAVLLVFAAFLYPLGTSCVSWSATVSARENPIQETTESGISNEQRSNVVKTQHRSM